MRWDALSDDALAVVLSHLSLDDLGRCLLVERRLTPLARRAACETEAFHRTSSFLGVMRMHACDAIVLRWAHRAERTPRPLPCLRCGRCGAPVAALLECTCHRRPTSAQWMRCILLTFTAGIYMCLCYRYTLRLWGYLSTRR